MADVQFKERPKVETIDENVRRLEMNSRFRGSEFVLLYLSTILSREKTKVVLYLSTVLSLFDIDPFVRL